MSERRIVITGQGAVTPLGIGVEAFWNGLKAGQSGVGPITAFDTEGISCKIAAQVADDFDASAYFNTPKEARRCDRYCQFGVAAAKMAWQDSGLDENAIDLDRAGVMIGSGIGGLNTHESNHLQLIEKGPRRVSPFTIPMMISNICSGIFSMELGLRGPNMTIVTACASSNHSIGEAWHMIRRGDADVMVSGGAEATIFRLGTAAFNNMKALSSRNEEPERASRPWDQDRDGFVMGEGAGIVVLEELEHAKKRGANILAELIGYGVSADAYHLSAPHPEGLGAAKCMENALRTARKNPEEIDYINAHGTSTPVGDLCETKAIKTTFADHAKENLVVSSTKSMTGHLLGAAGGAELIACVETLREGIIAPTINLENPSEGCDLDYCAGQAREMEVNTILSNSFGFGGHNASLVLSKFTS